MSYLENPMKIKIETPDGTLSCSDYSGCLLKIDGNGYMGMLDAPLTFICDRESILFLIDRHNMHLSQLAKSRNELRKHDNSICNPC